jgi:hypothetical protein
MPLITHGSFDAFQAVASGAAATNYSLTEPLPLSTLREITRAVQPVPLSFVRSDGPVTVTIDSLILEPGSRSMVRRVLDADADLRVLAWCWDLSGDPPMVWPAADTTDGDAAAETGRLDLVDMRRVLRRPLPLWRRPVVGGLTVRVIVWQGEHPDLAAEIAEAMRHSALAAALDAIGPPARTTVTSAMTVRGAAGGLGTDIAPVLRALCPDYIDFFEGFLPAGTGPTETVHQGFHGCLTVRVGAGTPATIDGRTQ